MALSSEYAAILNELNREVLRSRPTDPLQFCANWFNKRLEEQRSAQRGGAVAGGMQSVDPIAAGPAPSAGIAPGPPGAPAAGGLFASANPFGNAPPAAAAHVHRGSLDSSSSTDTGDEEMAGPGAAGGSGEHFAPPAAFNYARRTSVSAESLARAAAAGSAQAAAAKTVIPKTDAQLARIRASIGNNLLFRNLEEDQYNDVLLAMKEVKVDAGVAVIEQGAQGDYFYVVEEGTLDVYIKPGGAGNASSGSVTSESDDGSAATRGPQLKQAGSGSLTAQYGDKKSSYGPGHSFGELALLYLQPRAASIISTSPCTLWALDRVTFRSILMETNSRKRALYDSFLKDVALFEHLSDAERAKISDALEVRTYEVGQRPVKQGERGTEFFIVVEGVAEVRKRKQGGADEDEMTIGRLGRGDYFGELALLNNAPRAASIVAAAPLPGEESAPGAQAKKLRVATLSEKAFTRLLGPLAGIMGRYAEERYGTNSTIAVAPRAGGAGPPSIAVTGGTVGGSIAPHQTAGTAGTWTGGNPFGQPPSART